LPEKYDPELEKAVEAYISWQTIRIQFGNLIVEFQLLESVLKDAISHLLNPHDYLVGQIVTTPMQFRQILGVLYCDKCAQKRNAIVHSYWTLTKTVQDLD